MINLDLLNLNSLTKTITPDKITLIVIIIIIIIFSRGTMIIAKSNFRLRREKLYLHNLRSRLNEIEEMRYPPDELFVKIVPLENIHLRKSWIAMRTHTLHDHIRRDLNPDLGLLRKTDEDRVESELSSPVHWGNTSVLFGLLGTFLGLTISIGNINPDTPNEFDLSLNVASALSGAKTAFFTSITGVLSMVFLSTFVSKMRRNWNDHLEQVNRFVEVDLIKAFFQGKGEDRLQQGMADLARISAELGEKVGQLGNVAMTIQNSLSTLVVASRAFQDGAERLGELRQSVEAQMEASQSLNEEFMKLGQRMADNLSSQGAVLGEAGNKFDQLLSALTERREELGNALVAIQQAFAGLATLPEDLAKRLGEEAERTSRQHVDVLKSLNDTYLKRLGPDNEALHETTRRLQAFATETLPALQAALKGVGEEIRKEALPEFRQFSQRLHGEMQVLTGKHREQFEQYMLLVADLRQSIETLVSLAGRWRN